MAVRSRLRLIPQPTEHTMSETKADSGTSPKKATVDIVIWIILGLIVLAWGAGVGELIGNG